MRGTLSLDLLRLKKAHSVSILRSYVERLFEERLILKLINGRPVTARQLSGYFKTYCELFKEARGAAGSRGADAAMT